MPEYDYYELLEVDRQASSVVIERAYKALAQRYHPDNGGSPRVMQMLNEAHEVLVDPQRRAAYDACLPRSSNASYIRSPGPSATDAEGDDPIVALVNASGAAVISGDYSLRITGLGDVSIEHVRLIDDAGGLTWVSDNARTWFRGMCDS